MLYLKDNFLCSKMVRNYIRKTKRADQYTPEILANALEEIKNGTSTIYRAHKRYGIPKTTLFYHLKGIRGKKSNSQGRAPAISLEDETKLANALKTMEKWGFGITRKEVLGIVREYITTNFIKTPFKENTPGEDWFLKFKSRHGLSIKKPQSVEYARKKMTDPFVIYEYFDILEKLIQEDNLSQKPELIWNLDESSFSHDPSKTKVVGARGKPSSRTTSGPGREHTTILSAVSASGHKAPPLIVFKGKNIWDSWIADERNSFEGMSYAASAKGWMETEIFYNYFQKTLIPALGTERPVLLIYDGHSTHVNVKLVELARDNNIKILKLPPHTSHLLQPLDLAVFKSLKDTWDKELVVWQRRNMGHKIPKKKFSELLGSVWKNLSPDVIKNGFKKAGIAPVDRNVIPIEKFDPESLTRYENEKKKHVLVETMPHTSNDSNTHSVNEEPDSSTVNAHSIEGIPGTSVSNEHADIVQTHSSNISFEQLLLQTVKQTNVPNNIKKRKVAQGAEVVTESEVLRRLVAEETERITKIKNKTKQKPKEAAPNKAKRVVTKKRKRVSTSSESSDELSDVVVYTNSDDDLDPEIFDMDENNLIGDEENEDKENEDCRKYGDQQLAEGKWVLVEYRSKKQIKHFVGLITNNTADNQWCVKFAKYRDKQFTWPPREDTDTLTEDEITTVLPTPSISRWGYITFQFDFSKFNL